MIFGIVALVSVFTADSSMLEPQPTEALSLLLPTPIPTPTPPAAVDTDLVYNDPIITYGNNTCEAFYAGGACTPVLVPFPHVLTNLSRADQTSAIVTVDTILGGLMHFEAPQHCFQVVHPLFCRYSFPTCDPAYRDPTYQPICRRDCQVVRDFLCREPWQAMLQLLTLLQFDYVDPPDCEPLGDTEAGDTPMCINTINKDFLPQPLLTGTECYSGRGRGYQGTLNVTSSEKPCQSWDVSLPHQHLLAEEGYVELAGGHNYCRNPGERGRRPWCFTTDNNTRWEYCDVAECAPGPTCIPHEHDVCRTVGTIGMDWIYVDTATTDLESRVPDVNTLLGLAADFSEDCRDMFVEYICVSNFPSCDTSHVSPRPIEPCQQFCERVQDVCGDHIQSIVSFQNLIENVNVVSDCSALPSPDGGTAPECYLQNTAVLGTTRGNSTFDCYTPTDLGASYRGNVSITTSGKLCQHWISRFPHAHQISPLNRPELESNNQCRNPDGRGQSPWCYTTDPATRWEYCDIPVCAPIATISTSDLTIEIFLGALMLALLLLLSTTVFCFCYKWRKACAGVGPTNTSATNGGIPPDECPAFETRTPSPPHLYEDIQELRATHLVLRGHTPQPHELETTCDSPLDVFTQCPTYGPSSYPVPQEYLVPQELSTSATVLHGHTPQPRELETTCDSPPDVFTQCPACGPSSYPVPQEYLVPQELSTSATVLRGHTPQPHETT